MKTIRRVVWRLLEWPIALMWLAYAKLVTCTSRITVEGNVPAEPSVFINWHRYQPILIPHHGSHGRFMLVSPAPPIFPVARFCRLCGLRLVVGTSRDRGKEALEEMAKVVTAGGSMTLAVDGPAGPAFEPKRGCVELSLRTGVPMIPVKYECRRGFTMPMRWDRTLMPLPLDRIVIHYGDPIRPDRDAESLLDQVRHAL